MGPSVRLVDVGAFFIEQKGRPMDGIIPLYKERGMTSFDCIARLRRILHTKKVGHSGTLDPNVDGVLPIAIGNATKAVEYLMASGKEYAGELTIGLATTTEDLDGEVVDQKPVPAPIAREMIAERMAEMTGEITQVPPMYSAVKVKGKRLYEYARAGETVERPKRQVTIDQFTLLATSYDQERQVQRVRFKVACSKGTYVRTLAVDLAAKLGYPGVMSSLTRLKSGGFTLDQTLSLDDIQDMVTASGMVNLYPLDYAVKDLPHLALNAEQWQAVQNGGWLKQSEVTPQEPRVVVTYQGDTKAVYKHVERHYQPEKMFKNS